MKSLLIGLLLVAGNAFGSDVPLEKKLDNLNIPDDRVSSVVSEDRLFIVNKRYSSLVNRHEITMSGAYNFTPDSHLTTRQLGTTYRYHLNSSWSFGARYQKFYNELSSAGQKLFDEKQIVPDSDFALSSSEVFANYNTIYGKLRFSSRTVVYFDQYISLGAGKIELDAGKENLLVADLGFSFWLGKHMSTRVGVRNEFYSQEQVTGRRDIHNAIGYFEVGYLFGQGS
jgi:outer membrane beta-barrel protein